LCKAFRDIDIDIFIYLSYDVKRFITRKDVPGLIDGAADGAGLGHAFLRHVERCHVILHLVDATSIDPLGDFRMINGELSHYGDGKLAKKPQVVVVNKIDAWDEEKTEEFEKGMTVKHSRSTLESQLLSAMPHNRLLWMSAKHREGVDELMGRMHAFVQKVKAQENNSC
jgi:GTP-binding protein